MKKGAAILAVLLALCLVCGGFAVYKFTSPEAALARTIRDVKTSGIEGLYPHLTENAGEKVRQIKGLSENALIAGVLSLLPQSDTAALLKEKAKEIDWRVEDVLRGRKSAEVVIGFDYQGQVTGTVDITMIRDGGDWKIDRISLPRFQSDSAQGDVNGQATAASGGGEALPFGTPLRRTTDRKTENTTGDAARQNAASPWASLYEL